jgi:hypothetical protein
MIDETRSGVGVPGRADDTEADGAAWVSEAQHPAWTRPAITRMPLDRTLNGPGSGTDGLGGGMTSF